MMVKLLLYGYATGVFSSRKLAKKLHEDVAFRVLAAGNFPAHRTLSDFRALHLQELAALFVQVVKVARECGLVTLGTIAVDGSKVKANASRHKAMSYQRMVQAEAQLKAEIDALLERARVTDEAERQEPELDLPAELARREARLRRSRRPRHGWRSASATPTAPGGAIRTMTVAPVTGMERPGAASAISAISGCRRTARRRASPIRRAGS